MKKILFLVFMALGFTLLALTVETPAYAAYHPPGITQTVLVNQVTPIPDYQVSCLPLIPQAIFVAGDIEPVTYPVAVCLPTQVYTDNTILQSHKYRSCSDILAYPLKTHTSSNISFELARVCTGQMNRFTLPC